jgi:hypothetical protein
MSGFVIDVYDADLRNKIFYQRPEYQLVKGEYLFFYIKNKQTSLSFASSFGSCSPFVFFLSIFLPHKEKMKQAARIAMFGAFFFLNFSHYFFFISHISLAFVKNREKFC